MKLISHRGNVYGINESRENEPTYIDAAIALGFDVEIDIWVNGYTIMLGHCEPKYNISIEWLTNRIDKLWIHCKNIEAIELLNQLPQPFVFFWHQNDTLTMTSMSHIWAYPGKQPIRNSIAVLPELHNENTVNCLGICSDIIWQYRINDINNLRN